MPHRKVGIAIPVGDPTGIGPEICLKAVLDQQVRAACDPTIVCDPELLARHAKACGLSAALDGVDVLACPQPETATLGFGVTTPAAGRASIAFCAAAVKAAMAGEVDAVVAAPQNETSIAQAGIKFDGHPSFVARQTGSDEDGVYMMLCFGDTRIAHCTLHRSVRDSIALITKDNVARTIRATNVALTRMGIAAPKIAPIAAGPAPSRRRPRWEDQGSLGEVVDELLRLVGAEAADLAGWGDADLLHDLLGLDLADAGQGLEQGRDLHLAQDFVLVGLLQHCLKVGLTFLELFFELGTCLASLSSFLECSSTLFGR